MQQLPKRIRFGSLTDVLVCELGDELIVKAIGHHHRVPDASSRDILSGWFITRRDGKAVNFRDYMNPVHTGTIGHE